MLQYVDGFTCAVNTKKDTLTIKFVQNEPVFPASDTEPENVKTNVIDIASVVMTRESAKALLDSIADLLSEPYGTENHQDN